MIQQIAAIELETKLKDDRLTLVQFTGPACGSCHQLETVLSDLVDSCEMYKVDVSSDEYGEFAARFFVMSLPTVLFFKNGKMVHQFVGLQDKEKIKSMIAKHK